MPWTINRTLVDHELSIDDVVADAPGRYYLSTRKSKTASGHPIWFGGVEIKTEKPAGLADAAREEGLEF